MKLKTFFDDEFRQFSIADCVRSIPSIVDGFKPSQRKCIYGTILRGENAGEIKIAQLGAQIALVTHYAHGELSLYDTLIGMAQDYAGSNNINYLSPNGQFGNRLSSEASAPRYIFTELTKDFRKIFKKEDDCILNYLYNDGDKIEPDFYLPILPNILINGAKGMGTGYATSIMKYNPNDLKDNILAILQQKNPENLIPWYRGFKGTIHMDGKQVINTGCYEIVNSTTIKITEIPIGLYLEDYKTHLLKMQDSGLIKDFDDYSTDKAFEFLVNVPRTTTQFPPQDILQKFKLIGRHTQNFTLWTEEGHIKVFDNAQEVVDHFVDYRLSKYEERRLKLIDILNTDLFWYNEKKRFILYYLENSKLFASKSKKEIESLLKELSFENISDLLDVKIYNLTKDEIEKLEKLIEKTAKEILALEKTNCVKMYVKELTELDL